MHIDTLDWPFGGKGRYAIEPNKVLWEYYTDFATDTAIIAEKIDAKLLILGTETDKLDKEFGQWKKITGLTREIYRGPITYSASFNGKAGFPAKYTKIKACGFCNVNIWPLFDYIGFEPYGGLTQKKDPTLEEMKIGFRRIMDEVAIPYAEKYNKKIIIPETSFFSFDGVNTNPISIDTGKYKVDDMPPVHEEQALAYQAMLEVLNENYYKDFVEGIILWSGYLTESSEKNRNWVHNDKWDLIWGKKAEDTIKKVFANWD